MNDQTQVRQRTRAPGGGIQTVATQTQQTTAAPRQRDTSWGYAGDQGEQAMQREIQRQEKLREEAANRVYQPWRFYLKAGEAADLIVLDEGCNWSIYEHQLGRVDAQSGKTIYDVYEPCPKELEPVCPICVSDKESAYVLFLTVIDMRQVTSQRNGKVYPFTKKLLAIKGRDQPFFYRQWKQRGTLRGLHLLMTRDTKNDSRIGKPEVVAQYDDAQILQEFGGPAVVAQQGPRQGQVIKQENEDCYPADYGMIFTRPSAEAIRKKYPHLAGVGAMGSAATNAAPATAQAPGIQPQAQPQGTDAPPAAGIQAQAPAQNAGAQAGSGIQPRVSGNVDNGAGGGDLDDDIPF